MKHNKPFGEVIESSLHGWLGQSWEWDHFPAFGSLVAIESGMRTLVGVVHQVNTGSMDPVRYPFPYKKTEDELKKEHPQIFEFLKTTFSCMTIGYRKGGSFFYLLAPEPPKIHAFISPLTPEWCKEFFAQDTYLHLLFGLSGQLINLDELLLAIMRFRAQLGCLSRESLGQFMHTYALLSGNEYRRMKLFVARAQQLLLHERKNKGTEPQTPV